MADESAFGPLCAASSVSPSVFELTSLLHVPMLDVSPPRRSDVAGGRSHAHGWPSQRTDRQFPFPNTKRGIRLKRRSEHTETVKHVDGRCASVSGLHPVTALRPVSPPAALCGVQLRELREGGAAEQGVRRRELLRRLRREADVVVEKVRLTRRRGGGLERGANIGCESRAIWA